LKSGVLLACAGKLPEVEVFGEVGLFGSFELECEFDVWVALLKPHLDSLETSVNN
jgi:hypothetical protein